MSFLKCLNDIDFNELLLKITSKDSSSVEQALTKDFLLWGDFLALISPAATPYLKQMAIKSAQVTRQRFGNTIQLFIPLYLSNICANICTYCGFSINNKIKRKKLNIDEIEEELKAIKKMGFEHLLVVTGEAPKTVGMKYFSEVLPLLCQYFSHVSMEVQPLDKEHYQELITLGLDAVYLYQETYYKNDYQKFHLRGNKSNFEYRLESPERLGSSGIDKIGLGVLLGLSNWRCDAALLALHLDYLEKNFWKTKYSISLPRIKPCEGGMVKNSMVSDKQLYQLIFAYRLFKPQVEISLSTRESETLRDQIIPFGITSVSAFSSTRPGGYTESTKSELKQFSIDDHRNPKEVAQSIKKIGLEPVWKDWDKYY